MLDVGLPDGSGLDVLRRLRATPALAAVPVILLTGRETLPDKQSGFEAGADHYLVKPVQIPELLLWAKSLLRRTRTEEQKRGIVRAGDMVVDPDAHTASAGGRPVAGLTPKEFDLLYHLVRVSPKPLPKEFIINELWKAAVRENTVEVHVRNLRTKLGAHGDRLVTVHGVGYKFE